MVLDFYLSLNPCLYVYVLKEMQEEGAHWEWRTLCNLENIHDLVILELFLNQIQAQFDKGYNNVHNQASLNSTSKHHLKAMYIRCVKWSYFPANAV